MEIFTAAAAADARTWVRRLVSAMAGTTTKASKAVVQRYLDALLAGDVDEIRGSFDEDGTWTIHGDVPFADPWAGRDPIVDDFLAQVGGSLFQAGGHSFDFPTLIGRGRWSLWSGGCGRRPRAAATTTIVMRHLRRPRRQDP